MSEQKPRARLDKAAIAILEDYVLRHPDVPYPSIITRKSLLEQVQKAQNNPDIKIRTIENWLRRRRSKAQATTVQQSGAPLTPISPISPSTPFSEENLRLLYTLVQTTSNPPPDVLDAWASLFHVSRPVLQYAITTVLPDKFPSQGQAQSPESSYSPVANRIIHPRSTHSRGLPTPADSLTPEPTLRHHHSDTGSLDLCKDEIISPILEHRPLIDGATRRLIQTTEPSADQQGQPQLSPPLTPIVPATKANLEMPRSTQTEEAHELSATPQITPLARVIFSGVLSACADAVAITTHPRPLPKTTAESDVRFAPYRRSLEKLSRILSHLPESASSSRR